MKSDEYSNRPPPDVAPRTSRKRHLFVWLAAIVVLYLLAAYVILPLAWRTDVRHHPELLGAPRITHTPSGIPGDPVNMTLLGSDCDRFRFSPPR